MYVVPWRAGMVMPVGARLMQQCDGNSDRVQGVFQARHAWVVRS